MGLSISTYLELKAAITNWLDVPEASFPTGSIDDLVTVGEKRLFREVRTRDMEYAINATISAGMFALPADYVAVKYIYIDGMPTQRLERRTAEWIYNAYPTRSPEGKPLYFARESTNFIFGPYPDSGYTVKGIYYRRQTIVETIPNALFLANPDLYLFACLSEAEPLIGRDGRIELWEGKYLKILMSANSEDRNEDHSGSNLQMRVAGRVS